eukprot:237852-Chlamydomonas_euryale.AAC.4
MPREIPLNLIRRVLTRRLLMKTCSLLSQGGEDVDAHASGQGITFKSSCFGDVPAGSDAQDVENLIAQQKSSKWLRYCLVEVNRAGVAVNRAGAAVNRAGVAMNRVGAAVNRAGVAMNRAGVAMNRAGAAVNRAGVAVNRAGVAVNRAGAAVNQAEAAVNQAGTTVNRAGDMATPHQGIQSLNFKQSSGSSCKQPG